MAKLLIVEDDPYVRLSMAEFLKGRLMTVEGVNCLSDAREYLAVSEYDLLILDWNLPDGVGPELLAELRANGNSIPTILLTTRSAIDDKVAGFNIGADDYLTKPFHPEELLARVQALLKRPKQQASRKLSVGEIVMDTQARTVSKSGQEIHLTPKEFSLMEFFLRHPNQVFSTEALLERVWKAESESSAESVNAAILRLRKKIDTAGKPSCLKNVFGSGYILESD